MLGNQVPAYVDSIAQVLTDGWTGISIHRATSQFGTYTKLVGAGLPITLVAGTSAYSYQDTAGASTSWYKTSLWNGTSDGTLSEAMPAGTAPLVTRGTLRQLVAYELDCLGLPNREFTIPLVVDTTGVGSTTTTVCADFIGTRWMTNEFRDAYLLATSGTENAKWRQINAGITGASGTFTHDAFATGVGNGATFEIYKRATPEQWNGFLNEALLDIWTPFRWPFAGVSSQTQYNLPFWIEDPVQVLGLTLQQGTTVRQQRYTGGNEFLLQPQEGGGAVIYLDGGQLDPNQIAVLEGYRHPGKLNADTDTLLLGEQQQRILVITAAQKAAEWLSVQHGGGAEDRQAMRERAERLERRRLVLVRERGTWRKTRSVRQEPMVGVGGGSPPISRTWSSHYRS